MPDEDDMTDLRHRVRRRTCVAKDAGRRLVVALEPGDVMAIRPERTRKWYRLPLSVVYAQAVRADVLAQARFVRALKGLRPRRMRPR